MKTELPMRTSPKISRTWKTFWRVSSVKVFVVIAATRPIENARCGVSSVVMRFLLFLVLGCVEKQSFQRGCRFSTFDHFGFRFGREFLDFLEQFVRRLFQDELGPVFDRDQF